MNGDNERLNRIALHHVRLLKDDWKEKTGATKNLLMAMIQPDRIIMWENTFNALYCKGMSDEEFQKEVYLYIKDFFALEMTWTIGKIGGELMHKELRDLLSSTFDDIDFEKIAAVLVSTMQIIYIEYSEGKGYDL